PHATEVPHDVKLVSPHATEAPHDAKLVPPHAAEVPHDAKLVPPHAAEAPHDLQLVPPHASEAPHDLQLVPPRATEAPAVPRQRRGGKPAKGKPALSGRRPGQNAIKERLAPSRGARKCPIANGVKAEQRPTCISLPEPRR